MTITKATWTQRLDAAGDFTAELPLSDPQAAVAQAGRVYRHYQEGRGFCFAGSMEAIGKTPEEHLQISGDSLLVELLHANTLIGKAYTNTTVDAIIDDLLDGTDWTRLGSIADVISVRFDGESVLRAIIAVVEMASQHVREVVSEQSDVLVRQLEIGTFGQASGVVVSNGQADDLAIGDRGMAAIPDGEFSIEEATTELWNWVLPLGAGEGTAQLTLVQQTRLPSLITVNPSFESGLTGWTLTSTPVADRTRSVHGSACVKMVSAGADKDVRQTFAAAAGATYRAEAWTWKETAGGDDRLIVEFLNGASVVLETTEAINDVTGKWIRLDTGDVVAPASTTSIRLRLQNNTPGNHTSYFDLPRIWRVAADADQPYDVLTEVTTPTALFAQINWYISDAASIAAYGRRQRPFVAKDIVPLAATKPAYQAAANSLYDLAAAQLDRWKLQQNAYRLGTLGLDPSVLPGDTIRLRYKGMARRAAGDATDERYMYVDLDEDLYVLERETTWDDYSKDTLLVSDLDRQLQNDDEVVIGKLEDTVRAYRTHVQTSLSVWAEHLGPELVNSTHTFSFNARVPDNVVQLLRLLCTITPRLIRSPVNVATSISAQTSSSGSPHSHSVSGQSASSGGGQTSGAGSDHEHQFVLGDPTAAAPTAWRLLRGKKQDGNPFTVVVGNYDSDTGIAFLTDDETQTHTHSTSTHTHPVSGGTSSSDSTHTHTVGSHGHNIAFGIFEGTSAAGIGIRIDGTLRTTELAGPWSAPITLDLTRYFLDNDGMVVQGDHTVELSSSQLGRIEARLEWAVTAAAIL